MDTILIKKQIENKIINFDSLICYYFFFYNEILNNLFQN